jgi:hypothetical protein
METQHVSKEKEGLRNDGQAAFPKLCLCLMGYKLGRGPDVRLGPAECGYNGLEGKHVAQEEQAPRQ